MLNRLQKRAWTFATNVLISTGKVPNALLLEHSLVVANAVVN